MTGSLARRKKELTDLRQIAQQPNTSTIIFKAAVVLAYSHWEGFFKETIDRYIEYARSACDDHTGLCDSMTAVLFFSLLKDVGDGRLPDVRFFRAINGVRSAARPSADHAWKAQSFRQNVTSEAVSQMLKAIGLDEKMGLSSSVWGSDMAIQLDRVYIYRRNKIAHGESEQLSAEDAVTAVDFFLTKLDDIASFFQRAVDEESFRASRVSRV